MSVDTLPISTQEVAFPWAKPPITATYLTFRARLRRARNRFAASAFARDVRNGWGRALVVLGTVGVAFAAYVLYRGAYVAAFMWGVA